MRALSSLHASVFALTLARDRCYNPYNHQTRQLAASCFGSPHHIHAESSFKPPLEGAAAAAELATATEMVTQRLGFVGIVELYSLSMCLLLHALEHAGPLPGHCHDEAVPFNLVSPVSYHVPKHQLSDVGEGVWSVVDDITRLDKALYQGAKARLLSAFEAFNRELPRGRPLGRHLLREPPL